MLRKIVVAGDHAAPESKKLIIKVLGELGFEVEDLGSDGTASVDYPDFAAAVAKQVASGKADCGVLVCGSGIGMSIAANKIHGVRAALVHNTTEAALSRLHNDANVLCLGGGMLGDRLVAEIVTIWVKTDFEGGRHARRVDKIMALESQGTTVPQES